MLVLILFGRFLCPWRGSLIPFEHIESRWNEYHRHGKPKAGLKGRIDPQASVLDSCSSCKGHCQQLSQKHQVRVLQPHLGEIFESRKRKAFLCFGFVRVGPGACRLRWFGFGSRLYLFFLFLFQRFANAVRREAERRVSHAG